MPLNTTAQTGYINIGAIGIGGAVFGMPIQALILGGASGAVVLALKPPSARANAVASVLTSVFLAGALTPLLSHWLALRLDIADTAAEIAMLEPLLPVVIGGGWSWAAPLADKHLKRVIERVFGGQKT